MTNKQWRKRYLKLRAAQTRVWAAILKCAPLVYTGPYLNKVLMRKDFYRVCLSDMDECIVEAYSNYKAGEKKCRKN